MLEEQATKLEARAAAAEAAADASGAKWQRQVQAAQEAASAAKLESERTRLQVRNLERKSRAGSAWHLGGSA